MYENYQYIKLNEPLEEISKIKVNDMTIFRYIQDIEINEEPNILIYCYNKKIKRIDMENIYSGIRILITNYELMRDIYRNIPYHIEYVIVDNKIYKNNGDMFEYIDFLTYEDSNEIINNFIDNRLCDRVNNKGQIILERAIFMNHARIEEIIELTSDEILREYGYDILTTIISIWYQETAIKIIRRLDDETINKISIYGESLLILSLRNECKKITEELIDRASNEVLNRIDHVGYCVLYYICVGNMSDILIRIIDRINFDEKIIESVFSAITNKRSKDIGRIIKEYLIKKGKYEEFMNRLSYFDYEFFYSL